MPRSLAGAGRGERARTKPRHFETLPSCAYVVSELLSELGVETLLTVVALPDSAVRAIVNLLLEARSGRARTWP